MLTIFLVKFWEADVCDDRSSILKDICGLVSEVLAIGLL